MKQIGCRCCQTEERQNGQRGRGPPRRGEPAEPDRVPGLCQIVGGGGDQHRSGEHRQAQIRRRTLGETEDERVDVACANQCGEGENTALTEY